LETAVRRRTRFSLKCGKRISPLAANSPTLFSIAVS
jgi:hypothetical protein